MSIALARMVKDLERRLTELETKIENTQFLVTPQEPEKPKSDKLCPKCGKVPAYYFHVKHCKGIVE